MNIILFAGIVLSACLQSLLSKAYRQCSGNVHLFNMEKALCAFLLFAVFGSDAVNLRFWLYNKTTLYAVSFAVFLCVSMYFGYQALCIGPVSLTSLIVSFSLILPCVDGIIFLREPVTFLKISGFIFLLAAMLLTRKSGENGAAPLSKKWAVYTLLTMVSNGLCSCLQKLHQIQYPGMFLNAFLCLSMLLATLFFMVILLFTRRKIVPFAKTKKRYHMFGMLSGFANA